MVAPLLLGLLGGMASAATAKSKEERAMAAKMAMLEAQQEADLKKTILGQEGGVKALAATGKSFGDISSSELISQFSQMNQVEVDLNTFKVGNLNLPTINAFKGSGFDQAQAHLSRINTYFAKPENIQAYNALSDSEKKQFSQFLGGAISMYDQRATKMEGGAPLYGAMQTAEEFAPIAYHMFISNPYGKQDGFPTGQGGFPANQQGGVNIDLDKGKTTPLDASSAPFESAVQTEFGEIIKESLVGSDNTTILNDAPLRMTQIYQNYFPEAGNVTGLTVDVNTAFSNLQKLFSDRSKNFSEEAGELATQILRTKTGRDILFGRYVGREMDLQTLFRDFIDPRNQSQVGTFIDAINIIMPSVHSESIVKISDTEIINTTTTGGKIKQTKRPGNVPEDKEEYDAFIMRQLNQAVPFTDVKALPKNYEEFAVRRKSMQESVNTYEDMAGLVTIVGRNNLGMKISILTDSAKNAVREVASFVSGIANAKDSEGNFIADEVARENIGNILKDYKSGDVTVARVLEFYAYQAAYQRAKALEGAGARLSQQDFDRAYANVRGALAETNEMTKIRFQLLAGDSFIENVMFTKANEALQLVINRTNVKEHVPFIKKFVRSINAIKAFRDAVPKPISVARELYRAKSDGSNVGRIEEYRPTPEALRSILEDSKKKFGDNVTVDASVFVPVENVGGEKFIIPGFDVYFIKINTPEGREFKRIPLSSLERVDGDFSDESGGNQGAGQTDTTGFDVHPETGEEAGPGLHFVERDGKYILMPKGN